MNTPRRRCSALWTARASFGVGANRSRRGCTDVTCRLPWAACPLALCFALAGCSAPPGPAPWFDEQAQSRGLDFRHRSGFAGRHLLPEIIGGGVALADFDGDGDLDIYFVQGGSVLEPGDHGNRLYFNRGDGTFEAAPDAGAANRGYGIGVAAGDYDNDGDVDLYVTNYGPNVLLRNDGSGAFEDVSERAGIADDGFGTAATFFDLEPDGDLDLFVANYVEWHPAIERDCYIDGFLTYCPPQNYGAPAPDRLYRNNGDGTFADATPALGLNAAFGNGLGAVAADFNRDGLADLFVANDMMVNQLWINTGAGLIDEAPYRGVAVDEHGMAKAGMGVATGDVDADGDTDLLVVNLRGQTDSFFRNQGEWFEDATEAVGLSASSRRHTRFGVVLADFDNDGWLDLYQANGRVAPREPRPGEDEFAEPNMLYRGSAEGFQERPLGGLPTTLSHTSRGLAVGDVDNDGGLDLVVANRDAAPYLLLNRVPNRGNWVRFHVRLASGRDAHGATVSATVGSRRLHRAVRTDGSYLATSDPRVHFGLGTENGVRDVRVRWPDGTVEAFGDFEGGRTFGLREGG